MTTKKSYSQAARVQGILRTLGVRQGITIGELAEEFGVTKRTLYWDLKTLEQAIRFLPKPLREQPTENLSHCRQSSKSINFLHKFLVDKFVNT